MKYGSLSAAPVLWAAMSCLVPVAGAQEAAQPVAQVVELAPSGMDATPVAEARRDGQSLEAPPKVLRQVLPEFPAEAREQGWQGRAYVNIVVGVDGRVADARIRSSSGYAVLDEAALQAVRQWQCSPALGKDGKPVQGLMQVPMHFVNTD